MPVIVVTRRRPRGTALLDEFLTAATAVLERATNSDDSPGAEATRCNGPDQRARESSTTIGPTDAEDQANKIGLAQYLWEEFKYRHDLIWRLLFRITFVAVVLSIAPFTIGDLAGNRAGMWVKFLPALAVALVLASEWLLWVEWRLFKPVNDSYVEAQNRAVPQGVRPPNMPDIFKWTVHLYPVALLILTILVTGYVWVKHIPS